MISNTLHWQKLSRATVKSDYIFTYKIEKKILNTSLRGVDKVN
jgi:hypothetical protein